MKVIELDLDPSKNVFNIKPFQERISADESITVSNIGPVSLKLTFLPSHPFSFPSDVLVIPKGETVKFQTGSEVHFIFNPNSVVRPRARSVIITILQPDLSGSDPMSSQDYENEPGSDGMDNGVVITLGQKEKQLTISPETTTFSIGQTVSFSNETNLDLELSFGPATPFSNKAILVDLDTNKSVELKTESTLVFDFRVTPFQGPANQRANGRLRMDL